MMLTSLCREYYQFLLCQGIFSGICSGMVFNSAMTVAGQYFFKKRAMAMAFASTGSPIGGTIYPIIMTNMLHASRIGFPWGQRVCGFLSLFLLAVAAITIRPTALRRSGKFMLLGAFKKPEYSLQLAGLFLVILGLWTPYFYLATYGLTHGMSPALASYLFALINGGSFVGRVLSGSVARFVGQFNLVTLGCYCSAILLFCWLAIESTAGLLVFSVLYGGSSGMVIALMPSTLAHTADHPSNVCKLDSRSADRAHPPDRETLIKRADRHVHRASGLRCWRCCSRRYANYGHSHSQQQRLYPRHYFQRNYYHGRGDCHYACESSVRQETACCLADQALG